MEQNILIVLSGRELVGQVSAVLSQLGLQVALAFGVRKAVRILNKKMYEFILLYFSASGADILLEMAAGGFPGGSPYLIAAADFSAPGKTRTELLEGVADARIGIPVDMAELAAVIRAAMRRIRRSALPPGKTAAPKIQYRDLVIDRTEIRVTMKGKSIHLALKEYGILLLLAEHPGMTFTKEQIYRSVWEDDYGDSFACVSDQIYSMRRKLGLDARDNSYIETVPGFGYRFHREE